MIHLEKVLPDKAIIANKQRVMCFFQLLLFTIDCTNIGAKTFHELEVEVEEFKIKITVICD